MRDVRRMNRSASLVAAIAFLAIGWIIALANSGSENEIFDWVKRVPFGDKIGHMVLFGLLAFLANRAFRFRFVRFRFLQIGSLVVLTFALGEELTQHFNPNRTLDALDALFDVVGVAMANWIGIRNARK